MHAEIKFKKPDKSIQTSNSINNMITSTENFYAQRAPVKMNDFSSFPIKLVYVI